ncbi:MAG: hypothetical protein ACI8PD_001023, partial [Nitrospinales bacterium]
MFASSFCYENASRVLSIPSLNDISDSQPVILENDSESA